MKNKTYKFGAKYTYRAVLMYQVMFFLFNYIAVNISHSISPDDIYMRYNIIGWTMIAFQAFAICIVIGYLSRNKINKYTFKNNVIKEIFKTESKMRVTVFICCVWALLALQLYSSLFGSIVADIFSEAGKSITENSTLNKNDYDSCIAMIAYSTIMAPICEEIVYRGILLKPLRQYGNVFAVLISSLLFAVMHGDIRQSIFAFIAGLLFGYVACEYSIKYSIALHIFNNTILGTILPKVLEMNIINMNALLYTLVGIALGFAALGIVLEKERVKFFIEFGKTTIKNIELLLSVSLIVQIAFGVAEMIMRIT